MDDDADHVRKFKLNSRVLGRYVPDGRCPCCSMPMTTRKSRNPPPEKATRDHILPRARGGELLSLAVPGVRNIRIICKRCNERRGLADHCWALVMCAKAIREKQRHGTVEGLLQRWQSERMRAEQILGDP